MYIVARYTYVEKIECDLKDFIFHQYFKLL